MRLDVKSIRELPAEEKILSFTEMIRLIRRLRFEGTTVVLAQGVFDIVHLGHVGYLQAAQNIDPVNSIVIAGIENDEAVRQNKGDKRPINPASDRSRVLAEFKSTGFVFTYEDAPRYDQPSDYIARYKALGPAAVVVPTWDPHRNLKEWQAKEAGTNLALVTYKHLNSTSRMLRGLGYE